MLRQTSSYRALCQALVVIAAITFQGIPGPRAGLVLAKVKGVERKARRIPQQQVSATAAQPQRTPKPNVALISITATNRDTFPNHGDGMAHEGDTITYTVVVTNNGDTDATGVVYTDNVDVNTSTLVPGSPAISPIAIADTYAALGNVRINTSNIAAGPGKHVTDNDSLTNGGALSGFGNSQATANGTAPNGINTVTTTNSGTVTMNADGSFTYNPAPGFTGADSFFYAVTSATTGTGTAKVTLNVSSTIWFIDNSGANGDGRLNSPFNSIANYNASAPTKDPNDIIFIYTGTGAYTGNLTLVNGMQLIGQGVDLATGAGLTVPPASDPLPTAVSNPNIDSSSDNTVTLAQNNTIRGLNLRDSVGIDLTGTNFGTLTVSAVGLTGTGRPLNLTTGTLAATFTNIISTSSSGGQGIALTSVGGSMAVTAGTSITNPATQGILVTGATANIDFGNTTITGGTNGVSLQNNSAGTRTFGTLSISNGTGANPAFLHAVGGGLAVAGTTTITNPAGTGIDIQSSTTLITFGATTINKNATTGTGVNLGGAATGNTGNVTFSSLDITTSSGSGLVGTENSGTVTVTNNSGSISATGGPAINITKVSATSPVNMSFTSVSSNSSGTQGVNLSNVSGTITVATGGTITGSAGTAFNVNGGSASVTYPGNVTQNNAQRVVDVQNSTAGAITLGGTITGGASSTGVNINAANGSVSFANLILGTSGLRINNQAVTVTGGTGTYSLGTVSIFTNNVQGIVSTNADGTLNSTSGTVDAGTATAINVDGPSGLTTLGMTLTRIDSSGGTAAGIIIQDTNGSFTVNGDGSNTAKGGNGTGGTIANKDDGGSDGLGTVGTGVFLNNALGVTLRRMQLNDHKNFGIRGLSVSNFILQYSTINGANGDTVTGSEGAVGFGTSNPGGANGLLGSGLIDNCQISGAVEHNMEFYNQSGNLNSLTISNSDIKSNSVALGSDGVQIEMQGSAAATISIQSCLFDDNKSQAVQAAANDSSTIDITINACTLQRTTQGNEGFILSNGSNGDLIAHVTNNVSTGIGGAVIFVGQTAGNATAASSLTAVISGNTITHPASATNSAIIAFLTSTVGVTAPANILIDNNTVTENSTQGVSRGIFVDTPDNSTTPSFTATVVNNTVSVTDNVAGLQGIGLQTRRGAGCFDVRSNTVTYPNGTPAGVVGLRLRQVSPGTINLEQGASAGSAATVLAANNAGSTTEVLGTVTVVGNSTCSNAPTIAPPLSETAAHSGRFSSSPDQGTVRQSPMLGGLASDVSAFRLHTKVGDSVSAPVAALPASAKALASNYQPKGASELRRAVFNHARKPETRWGSSSRGSFMPLSGGTVNLNVGTLSAGSSVTITYQVTVNSAAPAGATFVRDQGTVTGSNFAPILTDDPDTAQPNDETRTPLLHPTAADGTITGRILTENGTPVEGAVVRLNGAQTRKTITDVDGNYQFDNVETGGFYTVTPSRANYNFNPFNRSFNQLANRTEALFAGLFTADNANPLDTAEYFIRQQYVDILGREPDEGGFNYWSDRILECGTDLLCVSARRGDVAAAFFIEQEFQQTGSFIYDVYKGALGRRPIFSEYSADRQVVVGGANLETAKAAFAQAFVQRAEFVAKYQSNTTADSFVDALIANVMQASGVDLSSQRDGLVARYNSGTNQIESRGFVLHDVADNSALREAEYNGAFVLTEYFGYLRRDPDPDGYAFWLNVLNNQQAGNFRGMVCAFITSTEYQKRFSAVVTRSNADCGQ